jgi:hypothetical protein
MNALHHNAAAASAAGRSAHCDPKIGEDVPTNDAVLWSPPNEAKAQPTSNCSEN